MGGPGSGRRWHFGANDTTGDYRSIDVRRWQRDGLLIDGNSFGWQWSRDGEMVASIQVRAAKDCVHLKYRHRSRDDAWKDENYPVRLDWTPCPLGGTRPWFLCPVRGCGRRVAILYGGGIFACRHCYRLAYQSQRETPDDRAARRADRIRAKLGWEPGILNGEGLKPKGMHQRKFARLVAEHDRHVAKSCAIMAQRFGFDL